MSESNKFKTITLFLLVLTGFFSCTGPDRAGFADQEKKIALVLHGGAGTIKRENVDSATEVAYREKLREALHAGYAILEQGGASCEAVTAAITILEDSPLFNAGKGAVFTATGENELDASIMEGKTLNAGAVAGITTVKNPILAAYKVMVHSPHVMLAGEGADQFAKEQGLEIVDPEYFKTERRKKQLDKIQKQEGKEFGTVGAVAVDRAGNICAGTSTGGMTNKRWGRIGDSPIIGAGTYADNNTCGVSGTGHGEYFIRLAATHDVSALMKYAGASVEEAASTVIRKLSDMQAPGGIIALDRYGNVAMPFNTSGMYRGYKREGEDAVVKIYQDE